MFVFFSTKVFGQCPHWLNDFLVKDKVKHKIFRVLTEPFSPKCDAIYTIYSADVQQVEQLICCRFALCLELSASLFFRKVQVSFPLFTLSINPHNSEKNCFIDIGKVCWLGTSPISTGAVRSQVFLKFLLFDHVKNSQDQLIKAHFGTEKALWHIYIKNG